MATDQSNMSVVAAPQMSQHVHQPTVQLAHAMEFMIMLSNMMNLLTMNSHSVEMVSPGTQ